MQGGYAVIVTFKPISCSWEISDVVGSGLVSKTYLAGEDIGYTKDEAIKNFTDFVRRTEDPRYEPEDITVATVYPNR